MGLRGEVVPSLSWIARLNEWCLGNNLDFDLQKTSANCWYFRGTSVRSGVFLVRYAACPFRDEDLTSNWNGIALWALQARRKVVVLTRVIKGFWELESSEDYSWVVLGTALGGASVLRAVSWFFKAGNCRVPVFQSIFELCLTNQLCPSTTG